MTIDEIAEELGISRNAAFAAAHRGEIKYVRFGKSMRVPKSWIQRLSETGSVKGPGQAA
jgi:excisionase family DNA binding protein